jgi:NADPH2:quinone reductase
MKAALCTSLEGPEGIEIAELSEPEPGPGEVVIRVEAAALNFLDTLVTRGRYQIKPALPFSPGAEMAGIVERLGPGADGFRTGQRVCGYLVTGAAREKVVAKAEVLVPVPETVGVEIAAGVSVTYGTAMHGLADRGGLRAGETIAVLGAAGGAGLAAVEIATLMGAKVIAVASSNEKLAICKAHGAQMLLNYAEQDLKAGLRELTGGKGVDIVYDCVGGEHSEAALRALAWAGRLLVIGFAAGPIPRVPLNLVLLKNCDIRGVVWGEVATRDPAGQRRNMERVLAWIGEGRLEPHIHATFPLARIGDALRVLEERKATGKVVLRM